MDNHALEQYKAKQANAAVNTVVPERGMIDPFDGDISALDMVVIVGLDRKSTRLNSSHT